MTARGGQYYYKSADQGLYDLYYFPDGPEEEQRALEGLRTMANLFGRWKFLVQDAAAKWACTMSDVDAKALFQSRMLNALQRADDELINAVQKARLSLLPDLSALPADPQ